jgi:putative intracellular protease/amidase
MEFLEAYTILLDNLNLHSANLTQGNKVILIVLPQKGFDPTEVSIPWKIISSNQYDIVFSTPNGKPASPDPRMIKQGLSWLTPFLMTRKYVLQVYKIMQQDKSFQSPIPYSDIDVSQFDAVHVPGGHGDGIRVMLESPVLQQKIAQFFQQNKIVGAVCSGVLLIARSKNTSTGLSVLNGKKTTAVTSFMEKIGWYLSKHWLGDYYRIHPKTAQEEISEAQGSNKLFCTGRWRIFPMQYTKKLIYMQFVVKEGNYISARWPGDMHLYAQEYLKMIQKKIKERQ